MIRASAPGKLFIAGEYAVVEPGEPAVLVAVDRQVTIEADADGGEGTGSGEPLGRVESAGHAPATWRRAGAGIETAGGTGYFRYVLAAAAVLEQLAGERGIPQRRCRMRVTSTLDSGSRKLGLGSSAAATVAAVRALDTLYGLSLTRQEVLKAALAATFRVSPAASGGDVAAAVFGGWIAYASPRRPVAVEPDGGIGGLLAHDWPGLCVRHIPAPRGLRLAIGWTGAPAGTDGLVAQVREHSDAVADFVPQSRRVVRGLIEALQRGDDQAVLDAVRLCRGLLQRLGRACGAPIETPLLRSLCDAAERVGAAAKPSGAGGGDCGIALLPPAAAAHRLESAWRAAGIQPLDLRVWQDATHPQERHPHLGEGRG